VLNAALSRIGSILGGVRVRRDPPMERRGGAAGLFNRVRTGRTVFAGPIVVHHIRRLIMMRTSIPFAAALLLVSSLVSPRSSAAQSDGQTCVAIVPPSVQGADGDASGFSNSLRDLLASYLTGPSLRAMPLEARLASQAVEEARQKHCDYVLITSIARKHNDGGLGRALGRAAGTAAWYGVPYGGTAAGAAARGAAYAGAEAVSSLAENTKAKDELTFEYRLGTPDTALGAALRTEKAKAKTDREDLLTPLVQKISESVAATVLKK